ncbi:MAG TPA: SBBP repeat-containing protein, partial [Candidatus Sulfotelmatobacter sp.]
VDVAYYGQGPQIEYDFVLGPHADSRRIQLKIEGADQIQIDDAGDLVLTVGGSRILQRRPVVYQDTAAGRKRVEARYLRLGRDRVGFQIGRYDSRKALVIDPALVFSTYFGGSGTDDGNGVALDASGNIYRICLPREITA